MMARERKLSCCEVDCSAGCLSNLCGKVTNKGKAAIYSDATSDLQDILRQPLMCTVLLLTIINFCVMCVELVLESDAQSLTH